MNEDAFLTPEWLAASWSPLFAPDQLVELRILNNTGPGTLETGLFDPSHRVEMAREALRLTRSAGSAYYGLNPVDPTCHRHRHNRVITPRAGQAVSDPNITHRRWLMVDADPERPPHLSSTDEEKEQAKDVAIRVRDSLGDQGWPAPVFADSGNGYHLLYRIDLPAVDQRVALVLQVLSARYNTAAVKIDQVVHNASRVCKFPYTWARKGDNLPDRPHRRSGIIDMPADLEPVSTDLLDALVASLRPKRVMVPVRTHAGNGRRLDIPAWLRDRGVPYRMKPEPEAKGRTVYVLAACPFNPEHRDPDACIMQSPENVLSASCFHNSCHGKGWKEFKAAIGNPERRHFSGAGVWPRTTANLPLEGGPDEPPEGDDQPDTDPTDIHLTDTGNARRFVADHRDDVRYCPKLGWLVWDGRRWKRDEAKRVQELAKETVARLYGEAAALVAQMEQHAKGGDRGLTEADKNEQRRRLAEASSRIEWALKSEDHRRITSMLALAVSDEAIVVEMGQLDSDPFAFNVRNGTIDLTTGILRPHSRADLITRLAEVKFEHGPCPVWTKFLSAVFAGDADLIRWLRRLCGYSLTGDVREQIIAVLHGSGGNGKSVFIETLLDIMGDYGLKANAELLLTSKNDRHETEKAQLAGRRFVATVETGEGRKMNETLVKELTGADRVRARFMKKDHFEFVPTFKLALATNHRPEIRGTDVGIWRRVRLVPFTQRFWKPGEPEGPAEMRADPQMRERLKAEYPAILAWMACGAVEWFTEGLGTCKAVMAATGEYQAAEDKVTQFVDEECERAGEAKAGALFDRYKAWALNRNEPAMSQTRFGTRLMGMGFEKDKSSVTVYRGLRLKPASSPMAGAREGWEG